MGFVRRHLSYANVVASLALFLALGGAAFAATQLPRNSVGTGQLKPEAVTAGKIAQKTRQQLQGARGAQGPQGKTGAKGATGARGTTGSKGDAGARGPAGADGTGPAFEVVTGAPKTVGPGGSQVLAENLPAGAYVVSANVAIEPEATGVLSVVFCTLSGGGQAVTWVERTSSTKEFPSTVSLSGSVTLTSAGSSALTCSTSVGNVIVEYANVIATQVKSQSRIAN
jgi:hypothetical protein